MFGDLAFLAGHRGNDRLLALENAVVDTGSLDLLLHFADAGKHAHDAAHAAEILHLLQLVRKIVEIKLALLHPLGHCSGFFRINVFSSTLNQRDNIAHAEDTVCDTGWDENPPAHPFSRRYQSA